MIHSFGFEHRTVSFKYDPLGRRIYKSSSSGTSIYAYDGNNLIEETNSSGSAVSRYSQGLNIDEPLAMLRSSATSYYDADGLGSITSLSSSAGSLAQTYGYDSFGKWIGKISPSTTSIFAYDGGSRYDKCRQVGCRRRVESGYSLSRRSAAMTRGLRRP